MRHDASMGFTLIHIEVRMSSKLDILTRRQVAARIGVTPQTLTYWESSGRSAPVPIVRIGTKCLYDSRHIARWLKRHEKR
jgi:DNA-binding XRE family transcriptional regulator